MDLEVQLRFLIFLTIILSFSNKSSQTLLIHFDAYTRRSSLVSVSDKSKECLTLVKIGLQPLMCNLVLDVFLSLVEIHLRDYKQITFLG